MFGITDVPNDSNIFSSIKHWRSEFIKIIFVSICDVNFDQYIIGWTVVSYLHRSNNDHMKKLNEFCKFLITLAKYIHQILRNHNSMHRNMPLDVLVLYRLHVHALCLLLNQIRYLNVKVLYIFANI